MTTFEIIILIALYLFAFGYMAMSFDIDDKRNNCIDRFGIVIAAATIGIICFPIVFAMNIWKKLNKEKQQ